MHVFDVLAMRILSSLAEGHSISRTADRLGYTQSGISKGIKRLEVSLGFRIVQPKGRGIELSEEGKVLGLKAQEILRHIDEMEQTAYSLGRLKKQVVKVAAFPSVAAVLLPTVIGNLAKADSGVRLLVTHAHPKAATRMLRKGQVDLALTFRYSLKGLAREEPESSKRVHRRIGLSSVMVAMHKDHELSTAKVVPLSMLVDEAWVVAAENNRHHLVELFRAASITPNIAFEVDDYVVGLNHVAENLGVALVPEIIVDLIRSPNIVTRQLDPSTAMEIELEVVSSVNLPEAVEIVMDTIQDAAERHFWTASN